MKDVPVVWMDDVNNNVSLMETRTFWNFDLFLSDIIVHGMREMRSHCKYSMATLLAADETRDEIMREEEEVWKETCDEILATFSKYSTTNGEMADNEIEDAFKKLSSIFYGLWT